MTLQEQAKEMLREYRDWENLTCDDYEQLQQMFEEQLRFAFRAGQRAGQERSGIQKSLETLRCDGCEKLAVRVTYREGHMLCNDCCELLDRAPEVSAL